MVTTRKEESNQKPLLLSTITKRLLGERAWSLIQNDLRAFAFCQDMSISSGKETAATDTKPFRLNGSTHFLGVLCSIELLINTATRELFIFAMPSPKTKWTFAECFPHMNLRPSTLGPAPKPTTVKQSPPPDALLTDASFNSTLWVFKTGSQSKATTPDARKAFSISILLKQCPVDVSNAFHSQSLTESAGLSVFGKGLKSASGLTGIASTLGTFAGLNLANKIVIGRLTYPNTFPSLRLEIPMDGGLTIAGMKSGKANAYVEIVTSLSPVPEGTKVGIKGELAFEIDGTSENLSVEIDIPTEGTIVTAKTAFKAGQLPLNLSQSLPKGLSRRSSKEALEAVLTFSILKPKLTEIAFDLELDDWEISKDHIALRHLSAKIRVLDPLGLRAVMVSISADFEFGQRSQPLSLVCSGQYPPLVLNARLQGKKPTFKKLMTALGVGSISNAPSFKILELFAEYAHGPAHFSASIEVAPLSAKGQGWPFRQLQLSDLGFRVSGSPGTLNLDLRAVGRLGGIHLEVEARYAASSSDENRSSKLWSLSAEADNIKMSDLVKAVKSAFSASLAPPEFLASLTIDKLAIHFSEERFSADKVQTNVKISCLAHLAEAADAAIKLEFSLQSGSSNQRSNKQITLDASIMIGERRFIMLFSDESKKDAQPAHDSIVATYAKEGGERISLRDMLSAIVHDDVVIPDLEINIRNVLLGIDRSKGSQTKTNAVFGVDLDAAMNLANLPLIGSQFDKSSTAGISDLQVIYATADFSDSLLASINDRLSAKGLTTLPVKSQSSTPPGNKQSSDIALPKGFNISGSLNLGIGAEPASLSTIGTPDAVSDESSSAEPSAPSASAGTANWISIQKTLGPLYFDKVGVRYEKGELSLLMSADISLAGLTIALDGLGVTTPLDRFDPSFELSGLGIDFKKGPLEIGGSFLHYKNTTTLTTHGKKETVSFDEYDGKVVVKTPFISLGAIGSYARIDGHPSLFIYATLDYPLGGPPFFFVKGLSGGFGYNRSLIVPSAEQLRSFPLIAEALGSTTNGGAGGQTSETPEKAQTGKEKINAMQSTLTGEMSALQKYIPPDIGEYWLGVGIHSTTFELLDNFSLITVAFGHRLEFHVLGITSFVTPPDSSSVLMRIEMATKASYIPDSGFLGFRSVLTPRSFLFDPACHLVGGMALSTWLSVPHKNGATSPQEGDFVMTIGGYHPKFRVPSYYPRVPRLGLNWQVSDKLSIKGGAYFALTGHAFMAGGFLDAVYHGGALKAWFKVSADFLITWKPYHYEAEFSIEIGASATLNVLIGTIHVTVSLSADLQLWGPEFGGHAKLHILFVTFSVDFGSKKALPPPISWDDFQNTFLPKKNEWLGLSVANGLLKTVDASADKEPNATTEKTTKRWVVTANGFVIITNSVVPSNNSPLLKVWNAPKGERIKPTQCGIAPMNLSSKAFKSKQDVVVTRVGQAKNWNWKKHFSVEPVWKALPAGLWGNEYQPKVNADNRVIQNTLVGFRIIANPPLNGESLTASTRYLHSETEVTKCGARWQKPAIIKWKKSVKNTGSPDRNVVLASFFSPEELDAWSGELNEHDFIL